MSHSYLIEQKIIPVSLPSRCPGDARADSEGGFRLLCATRYGRLGASSRLRLAQYRPWLAQAGIASTLRPFLSDRYITALYNHSSRLGPVVAAYLRAFGASAAVRRHDMLWIEKELLPWLPQWLERKIIGNTPYVLDFDDAWSLRYEHAPSALLRRMLGTKFPQLLRGAALTIAANQTLYDWACAHGAKRVLLLPTVIDLDHYAMAPEPAGPFTICWVGTPLTAAYLQTIAAALRRLGAEAPLQLLIIGAPDVKIPGVACEHAAWDEATEAELIARSHAGIMPLPDDDWARGKSGYKLIQYMAMGRAAVASPVGANRDIVRHGETGFLAQTENEWLAALRQLRDDPALRTQLGAAARRRVEAEYAIQVTAPILIKALQEVFSAG